MAVISSDTSLASLFGGSQVEKFLDYLETGNQLEEDNKRYNEKVFTQSKRMNDSVDTAIRDLSKNMAMVTKSFNTNIKSPLLAMKADSLKAYESIVDGFNALPQQFESKLGVVKESAIAMGESVKTSVMTISSQTVDAINKGFDVSNDFLENSIAKLDAFTQMPIDKQLILTGKVIVDGVASSISTLNEIIPESLDVVKTSFTKGIKSVQQYTKSSSDYLKAIFKSGEKNEDVGKTSSVMTSDGKDSDDANSGITDMLGKLPMPAFLKRGTKLLGGALKKAGPIAVAIGAGMSFVEGLQNAGDIVGKATDKLSTIEKVGAGLSNIISDITFGFVDAKSVYQEMDNVASSIKSFGEDMFNRLPSGVQDVLTGVYDFLFDTQKGILAPITNMFSESVDALSKGDYTTAIVNSIFGPLKAFFGADGVVARSITSVFNMLPNDIQGLLTDFGDTVSSAIKDIFGMIADLIPDFAKNMFSQVKDSVIGKGIGSAIGVVGNYFGFGKKEDSTVGAIPSGASKIPDSNGVVASPVVAPNKALSPIEKKLEEARNKRIENENKMLGHGEERVMKQLAENKKLIAQRKREGSEIPSISDETNNEKVLVKDLSPEQQEAYRKRQEKFKAFVASRQARGKSDGVEIASLVKKDIPNTKEVINNVKAKMNEKPATPAPVIVQQPAPAPKSKGKGSLGRQTGISDSELAIMNANMLD